MKIYVICAVLGLTFLLPSPARAEGEWEITSESEQALELGLEWLAANQGAEGNWGSNDLGLVGMGALAFLSAGHMPGRGAYGENVDRALGYIIENARPSGLLNIAQNNRDMYNHGLATFVLGQAYGMSDDERMTETLDRALQLIADVQCGDGGWDYVAVRQTHGHDLSLAVMQAKALRSAVDSGLEVQPQVIALAIESVREHYSPAGIPYGSPEAEQRQVPGQFTYMRGQPTGSLAMAAAGVVCLQEFGQYEDWRIEKSMEVIRQQVLALPAEQPLKTTPFDPYTLYYVGQACYQVGGETWEECYPRMRDNLARSQVLAEGNPRDHGRWAVSGHAMGLQGELYSTSVACFILAMPNRYLPILQEGRIEAFSRSE